MEIIKTIEHKEIVFTRKCNKKYGYLKYGWQSPLFYLNHTYNFKACSLTYKIKNIIKSIRLWIFHYDNNKMDFFIRVLGFYKSGLKNNW